MAGETAGRTAPSSTTPWRCSTAARIEAVRTKVDLPNYGVFDEKRVFDAGALPSPINFRGIRIGAPICEDIWKEEVVECLSECGAEMLIVPNGSPFDWTKPDVRMNIAVARVTESGLPLIYVNQVGGQDELVFDGASFVLNADRSLAVQLPAWREAIVVTEWTKGPRRLALQARRARRDRGRARPPPIRPACWAPATTSTRTAFPASCWACPAASIQRARRGDRRRCAGAGARALRDAALPLYVRRQPRGRRACAKALGVRYDTVPIAAPVEGFMQTLAPVFAGKTADITEENLQSRARGVILMAISNKLGGMVLTTGNKSEMSVGYATLYGDMNGGFNPIKDLYKMEVYALSRWRNAHVPDGAKGPGGIVIPERIITKAPTAELRENQTDQDSLPPYEVLDDILRCLVEQEMPLPRDHRARPRRRDRQEGRAAALHRRVQAPAGGSRRQDLRAQLRPRPALSHHQPFQRGFATPSASSNSASRAKDRRAARRRRRGELSAQQLVNSNAANRR